MRITRDRADASPRPTGSSRPRSPRLILTEPRQTNLIAPMPSRPDRNNPRNPAGNEKSLQN